jgi:hypothetical protein
MHRSSESIGGVAAALAKVQGELTNPEKSLTATIAAPGPHGGARSFRYAPLSSGPNGAVRVINAVARPLSSLL